MNLDGENRHLDGCIAEIRRLKKRNEKLEKVAEAANVIHMRFKRDGTNSIRDWAFLRLEETLAELEEADP